MSARPLSERTWSKPWEAYDIKAKEIQRDLKVGWEKVKADNAIEPEAVEALRINAEAREREMA